MRILLVGGRGFLGQAVRRTLQAAGHRVWLQMRMRDMAVAARQSGSPVPALYWRLARWWTAHGVPAFSAVVVVFWLMVSKPV